MTDDSGPQNPHRRIFLFRLMQWVGGLSVLGFLYPIIAYLSPKHSEGAANVLIDPAGKPITPEDVAKAGATIGLAFGEPTVVVNEGGKFSAFSAVCTHLGCIVSWRAAQGDFFCPCHAGTFDRNGNVMSGPPPRALKKYRVKATEDRIQLFEA